MNVYISVHNTLLLLSGFSFGLAPAGPLQVLTPVSPNQSIEAVLPLNTVGPVMKMEPLNNLQVTHSKRLLLQMRVEDLLGTTCIF